MRSTRRSARTIFATVVLPNPPAPCTAVVIPTVLPRRRSARTTWLSSPGRPTTHGSSRWTAGTSSARVRSYHRCAPGEQPGTRDSRCRPRRPDQRVPVHRREPPGSAAGGHVHCHRKHRGGQRPQHSRSGKGRQPPPAHDRSFQGNTHIKPQQSASYRGKCPRIRTSAARILTRSTAQLIGALQLRMMQSARGRCLGLAAARLGRRGGRLGRSCLQVLGYRDSTPARSLLSGIAKLSETG